MRSSFATAVLVSCLLFLTGGLTAQEEAALPQWIWSERERDAPNTIGFQTELNLEAEVERAVLRATADFSRLRLKLNGQSVLSLEAFDPPGAREVTSLLKAGANELEATAAGVRGPSAIAVTLEVSTREGQTLRYSTGPDWNVAGRGKAVALGSLHPHRWAENRLPKINAFAEYNQWKEALPKEGETTLEEKLSRLPPGFKLERLRVAAPEEGSWVSLVQDAKGRLLVAKEAKGLLRMTLSEDFSDVVAVEEVNDSLEECRGLVWKGDALFANANDSKALYRLRDEDGDDQFDEIRLLRSTQGGVGHGRNDLVLGPEGLVHAIHGDSVQVPEGVQSRAVAERRGPKELGHWLRTNEEGTRWEILARGLRNPYGIDFNSDGEAFTYDADNEGDVGLPFYRPTRINHLVSGANYGWHQDEGNTRSFPVYAPDTVPTTYDVGRGSPTAVKFATDSHFPDPFRRALFALDWAYGRIVAVHLIPRGASYYGSGEVFLEGRPLNVTDLEFIRDGSMLFVTGGRKTRSALYRISYSGKGISPKLLTVQEQARAEFSRESRQRRQSLERWHQEKGAAALEEVWSALEDDDPWIRHAARVGLEHQDVNSWRERALGKADGLGGLTALLALVRAGGEGEGREAVSILSEAEGTGWNRASKLTALRVYDYAWREEWQELKPRVRAQVAGWLESESDAVNREACRILARLDAPEAVTWGLRFLAQAEDQLEELHYLEILSEAGEGWDEDREKVFFRKLAHAREFSKGDRFMPAFFTRLEQQALGRISDPDLRSQWAEVLRNKEDPPPDLSNRAVVRAWTLADFSSAEMTQALELPDAGTGKHLFETALCSRCHVFGAEGRPIGPDLTTVARRFTRRDLLESILTPSQVVSEVYRNVMIRLRSGEVVVGRVLRDDFRKSTLYVSSNPYHPADLREIPKGEIESFEESPVSPMPPGLLNTLTREEILQLLAWMEQEPDA